MEKRINSFFQGMGMGINSFFKSRNEEWELIPFFEWEWEWDYNPKNEGMDPCLSPWSFWDNSKWFWRRFQNFQKFCLQSCRSPALQRVKRVVVNIS